MTEEFDKVKKSYMEMQLEEMRQAVDAFTTLIFMYYKALLDKGFDKQAALYLAGQYQNAIVKRSALPQNDGEEA